jgi:secondary thiamine-phosphate synthase enzyme
METLASAAICRCSSIHLATTQPTEFIDLTDRLTAFAATTGVRSGILNLQTLHTTTAVIVNEHEPLLLADFQALLEGVAPGHRRYLHDDITVRTVNMTDAERPNGYAHCRALLLPTAASINVIDSRLSLGRWQRVFFVELDGPRDRVLSVVAIGEARP